MDRTADRTSERNAERSYMPLIVLAAIVLFSAPVLYVLAIGPLVWLNSSGRITITPDSWIASAYEPLQMLGRAYPPIDRVIRAYAELWDVRQPTPPPVAPAYSAPSPATVPATAPATPPN